MKKINKMLFRDIKRYKLQMLAVVLIVFIGITLFSACVMSYKNLQIFKDEFYLDNNFLDAYVDGLNLDSKDLKDIEKIDGVSKAEGRLELEGFISLPDHTNGIVKIISYENMPTVNQLRFVSGEYLTDKSQVLISKNFAEFNKFEIDDNVIVKLMGKELFLNVNGIVESPEFIITIKSRDYVMPSIEDYGIIYISSELLHEMFSIPAESFNQIHLKFTENVDANLIKKSIENVLGDRFIYFTQRKDQISEMMAREDIGMISEIAYMFPAMFLFAAALVIFVMQKKLIDMQRSTIGVLKAIGYNNLIILSYYLKQSCLLGTLGSVLAILPSYFMSVYITKVYCGLVYIPVSVFNFNWYVIGFAVLLSNLFSTSATLLSLRSLLQITASEAMRSVKVNDINKYNFLLGFGKKLKSDQRMVLRNIFRNPMRSFFVIICYVIAFTLFAAPIFLNDSVNFTEVSQYEKLQSYDYKVVFNQTLPWIDINELVNKYDLNQSTMILEFPIEISNNGIKKTFRIIGVERSYKINDGTRTFNVPEKGILLPKTMASQLGVKKDSKLTIKLPTQGSKSINVNLVDTFDQYVGFSAYIEINELRRLLKINNSANGFYLEDTNSDFEDKKKEVEESEFVKRIDSVEQERSEFNTLLNLVNVFIFVMIIFGLLMGISSMYNSTMINIIDRKREWGMLKVIGYSNARILKMSFLETFICFLLSIPISFLVSIGICYILGILMSNEFYTNPFVINYRILLYPTILGAFITMISVFIYYRSIRNINTSEVVKIKE
ncbi:MAG: ABC transporter permease [Eubacterium sp.]|nr:ABC transporter permease [Eubacterium sp.]